MLLFIAKKTLGQEAGSELRSIRRWKERIGGKKPPARRAKLRYFFTRREVCMNIKRIIDFEQPYSNSLIMHMTILVGFGLFFKTVSLTYLVFFFFFKYYIYSKFYKNILLVFLSTDSYLHLFSIFFSSFIPWTVQFSKQGYARCTQNRWQDLGWAGKTWLLHFQPNFKDFTSISLSADSCWLGRISLD